MAKKLEQNTDETVVDIKSVEPDDSEPINVEQFTEEPQSEVEKPLSLIRSLRNDLDAVLKLANASENLTFSLVVVPEDGSGYCKTFDTVEGLVEELKSIGRKGTRCQVFSFPSARFPITEHPRYLITPFGNYLLSDVAPSDGMPEGYFGPPVRDDSDVEEEAQQNDDSKKSSSKLGGSRH